jgi:hypothetical protein
MGWLWTPEASVTADLQKAALEEWVQSQRVTIGLLGVNIGVTDAAVLGSLSLWILVIWFFYSVRRENHLIGRLLIDASLLSKEDSQREDLQKRIFYGISDYMVFLTITHVNDPIKTLFHPNPREQKNFRLGFVVATLFFLPTIAIGFVLFTDLWSVYSEAVFRWPHDTLYKHLLMCAK